MDRNRISRSTEAVLNFSAEVQEARDKSISKQIKGSFVALTGEKLEQLWSTVDEKDRIVKDWEERMTLECKFHIFVEAELDYCSLSPKVLTNFATDNEEFQKSTKKAIDDDMAVAKEILEGLVSADVLECLMTEEYRLVESEPDKLQQAINKTVFFQKVRDAIKGIHREIFVVLDGLDEFPQQSKDTQNVERKDFLDVICRLVQDKNPNLHILLVSGHENDIEERLLVDPAMKHDVDRKDVQPELEDEVKAFIARTLADDAFLKRFDEDSHPLIRQAFENGEKSDKEQVQKQIIKVPNNMATKYDRALSNVDKVHRNKGPLKKYVAQYWQKHYLLCKEAQPTESHVEKLEDLIDKLLKRGDTFESWLDWYNPDDDFMLSGFDLDHEEEESDEGDSDSDNNVDYQEDQSTGDIESEDRSIGSSNKSRKRRADPAYYAVKIDLFDIAVKMIERGDPCERPADPMVVGGVFVQLPTQGQLDEIRIALPDFSNCSSEKEWNIRDFYFKASFWSGINYILERLDALIRPTISSMADSFEHPGIFGHMEGLDDFDFWHSRRRQRRFRLMEEDWDEDFYWDSHPRFGIGNSEMDIRDSILLEMAQQQKSLQETLSRATKQMNRMETNLLDDNDHNSEDGNMEPHMVVNDLLPLVRDIVEFGKRCDELQEIATRLQEKGVPASAAGAMQSLSFEIVAAVARIVTSISESGARSPFASTSSTIMVAQTVHLIRTVRIPRIAKLAEAAAQHLSHGEAAQSTRNDAVLESGPAVPTDGDCDGQQRELQLEVAAAIDNLPGLVQDKVTSIIDQFQDEMCKRMESIVEEVANIT
ncbi:hypothetical protein UCDDA912_g05968 [Diaporthe ampelina]|uniref:Uncharacterized protein n=1 Tax=Diaporthe ampelina TaxID=1214573 RepID=A0A0G2FIX8_9PEZI|nr:hypothetical protein UCDDA912_g05968 [Diaporthe ampelina]